jgi:hypothetical protein
VASGQSEQVLDTRVVCSEVGDVEAGLDADADVVEGGGFTLDDDEAARMGEAG